MENKLIQEICELYNFNIGTALKLLFEYQTSENKLESLEVAKKLIKREIEFERFEHSFNPKDYYLPSYYDDLFLDLPKNIDPAIYHLYGYYDKKRLLKCLEYIDNEIFTLI